MSGADYAMRIVIEIEILVSIVILILSVATTTRNGGAKRNYPNEIGTRATIFEVSNLFPVVSCCTRVSFFLLLIPSSVEDDRNSLRSARSRRADGRGDASKCG